MIWHSKWTGAKFLGRHRHMWVAGNALGLTSQRQKTKLFACRKPNSPDSYLQSIQRNRGFEREAQCWHENTQSDRRVHKHQSVWGKKHIQHLINENKQIGSHNCSVRLRVCLETIKKRKINMKKTEIHHSLWLWIYKLCI